jgi:hypothetical protein
MTTSSTSIPKPLWDALENVLLVKSRDLMKDIAKTLRQPEKPLLDAFKAKKLSFHLLDLSDPTDGGMQCDALLCTSAVAHRCRKPVIFGQMRCPDHEFHNNPTPGTKPILQRIQTSEGETFFLDSKNNVFTKELVLIGKYEDETLTIFEIDEEEEFA